MNTLPSLLAELGTAQTVFLIGLALLIVILMVRSRRYFRQVTQYQIPRPDGDAAALRQSAQSAVPPRAVEQWEVAMHDLARDLSGQLDSKIRILELLIREAEKVSARLETALARARNSLERTPAEPAVMSGGKNVSNPSSPATASPPANPAATRSSASSAQLTTADKPRFDRIYALADAGLSPSKIANQIGSQVGEVELILGIRGEGRAARGS